MAVSRHQCASIEYCFLVEQEGLCRYQSPSERLLVCRIRLLAFLFAPMIVDALCTSKCIEIWRMSMRLSSARL